MLRAHLDRLQTLEQLVGVREVVCLADLLQSQKHVVDKHYEMFMAVEKKVPAHCPENLSSANV